MKAGRQVSALPAPCPWRPPLECGQVQQAHPLSCASYVCVGRTCPAGSSEFLPTMWPKPATSVPLSFQTRNRWLLPLMSTVASATTDFPEPSLSPPDSQVFTAPCVQEENLQGKFGFFDITVLSPMCPPLHLQHPAGLPLPLPFTFNPTSGRLCQKVGSQKRPLMSQCPAPPCPALPCPALPPALRAVAPPWAAGSLLAHALSRDVVAQGVYMFCTSAGDCT